MKNSFNYLLLAVFLAFSSCQDPFELTPTDIISGSVVFEDEGLADAFLADLYERALFHYNTGQSNFEMNLVNAFGGESRNFAPWQSPFGQVMDTDFDENGAGVIAHWPYNTIRECNVYIEGLPLSAGLDQDYIAIRVGEARFIRAWEYFQMVIRYGGVPIVTSALPADASDEELFVNRNSEKEVYDFIASEMDAIAAVLPGQADIDGRVTRWAALALKSRAMLYAASVANFGTQQLNGILGFPSNEANNYYQQSLSASMEIMQNGPFSLYRNNADPVENFTNLFLDEANNPEVIFAEKYDLEAGKNHSWDITGTPAGFGFAWNSNYPVYLETMELFDFTDGASGKVDRSLYDDATPIDPARFFGERDPRFRASVFYPGTSFKGGTFYSHRSTDYTDPATGMVTQTTAPGFIIPGSDGWPGSGHPRHRGGNPTGLLTRKMINPATPDGTASSTDVIIMRYGEILLNYVEAAFYLGDPNGDMATVFNDIRDRAGMPELTTAEITEDRIRQERRVELAFESQIFWDLRRWRTAVEELHNVQRHRTHYRYNYDTGMYTIAIADGDLGRVRLHPEKNYYYALGLNRIADNPNLVENPGY
ncbi:RagB/SusD family nutrient uptake outer membrane protein [Neolewinella persica]|uniref:RagB/SusD family nutrient uptake outer membrane protein n=1 Tax=Neolewinella persica TaxID=70998 RepID=UPI00036E70F0|nr:RagB/SusD family nutrient uptake outer membrane protein [Neolewinella persica]